MYAACVGITGYVPLPLSGDDYIELLPAVFRTVNCQTCTLLGCLLIYGWVL